MTSKQFFSFFPFAPRAYGMNPFSLSFSGSDEVDFLHDSREANLKYLRTAALLSGIAYLAVALLEPFWAEPETIRFSLLVRLGIVMPIITLFILSTFVRRFGRAIPALLQLVLIVIALVQFLLNVRNYPNIPVPIVDAYIMLVFVSFSLLRTRFLRSFVTVVFILGLMIAESYLLAIPPERRLFDFLIIISAIMMGGFVGYAVEYYQRQDWLLERQAKKDRELEIETAKLRTVQELARTIAHEFNNPLNVIQAVYDLRLRQSRTDETPAERRDYERIPRTVDRMSELVRRLLTITEIHQAEYLKGINYLDLHVGMPSASVEAENEDGNAGESTENRAPSE